jgi:hypothetical protein
MRTQDFPLLIAYRDPPRVACQARIASGIRCMAAIGAFAGCVGLLGSEALAQCADQGGTPGGSGSEELAERIQQGTIDQAKAAAGLDVIPFFAGVSYSASRLNQDGFKLKLPVDVANNGCAVGSVTSLPSFETTSQSASVLGEMDLTRTIGLPNGYQFRVGAAVGNKWLETKTSDISVIGATPPVNAGPSSLKEEGVQVDLYSLLAIGSSYAIVAGSIGSGNSKLTNSSADFDGTTLTTGNGSTRYSDYTFSVTVGHVFTLSSTASGRTLLDVNGAFLWSAYNRNGFTDSRGAVFSDTGIDEFAGKAELKLAYQILEGANMFTPYIKGGVKQRFEYDNSSTVISDPVFTFSAPFLLSSDDTFWQAGGGFGVSFNNGRITGVIDGTYQGSGDSHEVIGKAQLIFKLN